MSATPNYEDQLTRAALIVLKLVPLAHEAFLGLTGCERLSGLPAPRFDMQTEKLVPLGTEAEDQEVAEIVSVFLGPHENLIESKNRFRGITRKTALESLGTPEPASRRWQH
jgi:hypothetical protein